ncbi:MAG TPA: hypothetical protein PLO37_14830 [Candidatus Hydrogenedentes bacterium]|nr:hypothetical protein [Candidatus Hydrogenedentota bacterium]HPG68121.1 hypothetical protein [Candidatus Hydrogenedentota bacterium]
MQGATRAIIVTAMIVLTVVSMWTTYVSLKDSILPEPTISVPLWEGHAWKCSVFALALSVAIGLMLFALKVAIIDEQKKLNIVGVVGLAVIAFISISFNMDVLYRTADREFFLRYSTARTRQAYEDFLMQADAALTERRDEIRREVASQQGELEAEVDGLREAPEGYGPKARQEDYRLRLLEKTSEVDLTTLNETIALKGEADTLLRERSPQSIDEIQAMQNDLRVILKDVGARAGIPLPEPVQLESPLFAVFQRLFDFKTVGLKEIFFLLIAIFLDLGDIIGYSLVPNRPERKRKRLAREILEEELGLPGPEFVTRPQLTTDSPGFIAEEGDSFEQGPPEALAEPTASRRPRAVRFRRR